MKRNILIAIILFGFIGTALFCQSDDLAPWIEVYNGTDTITGQLAVVQAVAEQKIVGSGDFFAAALTRLVREYPSIRGQAEQADAESLARTLSRILGDGKVESAATGLWQVVEYFPSSLVKADAIIALGKINARAYLPQIVQTLNNLNTQPQADREMRERSERIAYGAILALESYQDPSGYLPVFFASNGWYGDRIKVQASISLPNIMENPTEPLKVILKSPYPYETKHLALRTSQRSNSSNEDKAEIAGLALAEGWKASTNEPRQRIELANMRKLALSMIGTYGVSDNSIYPLLDRSYREGTMDEKIAVIKACAVLSTDDSVKLLSTFLVAINDRRQSDRLTREDEQLVRVVIPAIGETGNTLGLSSLIQIQGSAKWTDAVKNLAGESVKKLRR